MMRGADELISNTISLAYFDNTIFKNGKLQNIVEMVRNDNNWGQRHDLPPAAREALEKEVNRKIDDLKANSPDLLTRIAKVDKDGNFSMPVITNENYTEYRQRLNRIIQETMGNFGSEDLALYKTNFTFNKFMMFKGWMAELVHKRIGPLEYDFGAHRYTHGRAASFVGLARDYGLKSVGSLLKSLTGNDEPLITQLKDKYQRTKQAKADKGEEFNQSQGDFIDMEMTGIKTQFREITLALGLLGMYFALLAVSKGNKDEDHTEKGEFAFALRTIDRLQDEISFFYNPSSFTSMFNGAIVPPVALLVDIQKLLKGSLIYGWDKATGNDEEAKKIHLMKIIYGDLPVMKEWVKYEAIWSKKFAEDNGISLPTQSGMH
jgi:hypothetical protein